MVLDHIQWVIPEHVIHIVGEKIAVYLLEADHVSFA